MIMVTVFLLILNQMDFHLVQNRKKNCHYDHIPFNLKGNGNIVFSVSVNNATCAAALVTYDPLSTAVTPLVLVPVTPLVPLPW